MKPKLRSLTDAERARIYAELGWLAYTRLWRQEMREHEGADNDAEHAGRAVARAGEAQRGAGR